MNIINRAFKGDWISSEELKVFSEDYEKQFGGWWDKLAENSKTRQDAARNTNITGVRSDRQAQQAELSRQVQQDIANKIEASASPGKSLPTVSSSAPTGIREQYQNLGDFNNKYENFRNTIANQETANQKLIDSGMHNPSYGLSPNNQMKQSNADLLKQGQTLADSGQFQNVAIAQRVPDGPQAPQQGIWNQATGAVSNAANSAGNWISQNPGTAAGIGAAVAGIGGLAYYLNKRRKLKQAGLLPSKGYRGFENKKEWLKFKIAEAKETGRKKDILGYTKQLRKLEQLRAFSEYQESISPDRLYSDLEVKFYSAVETTREYGELDTAQYYFYSDREGNVAVYDKGVNGVVDIVDAEDRGFRVK